MPSPRPASCALPLTASRCALPARNARRLSRPAPPSAQEYTFNAQLEEARVEARRLAAELAFAKQEAEERAPRPGAAARGRESGA